MSPPGAWVEEDEWYSDSFEGARHVRPRRPSRPRYLAPENTHSFHLHRTRSQGNSPTPHISIYNTVDDHQRVSQVPPSPRGSPRGRTTRLAEELDDLEALEELRIRARSRSRGPLFREQSPGYNERLQLELTQERLRERERERREEELKELTKREYEYKREKERRKRDERGRAEAEERRRIIAEEQLSLEKSKREADEERRRIIAEEHQRVEEAKKEADDMRARIRSDWDREEREAEELRAKTRAEWERQDKEAKAARQRAIEEWELKKRKEEDEEEASRKRVIEEYRAKQAADEKKAKDEEETWRLKIQLEDERRKEKEKKEWEEFLLKQKEKEEEEKRKRKEEEEALEAAMTKRLMVAGFQNNQIQAIMNSDDRHHSVTPGQTPAHPLPWNHQPTYIKVHRDNIAIETLTYFSIPWEYDRNDTEYIIILREMDTRETEMLFEHTRSLRNRGSTRLLIEERSNRKPDYAWVRHRSKSKSPARRRSSPKRVVGLKEMFF